MKYHLSITVKRAVDLDRILDAISAAVANLDVRLDVLPDAPAPHTSPASAPVQPQAPPQPDALDDLLEVISSAIVYDELRAQFVRLVRISRPTAVEILARFNAPTLNQVSAQDYPLMLEQVQIALAGFIHGGA
jgi:hypothetical protein